MTKIQEIENKLKSVNEAVFQNVCDAYLYFSEAEYPDIHRTGSQKGKQKTTKGTPDTFFILKNEQYILVEYTTQEAKESKSAFIKKIKTDIEKCLKEDITGIKQDEISKIIYCHNSSLTIKENASLINYYKNKKIKLEIKDIDTIAMGIYGRCPHIAREFLGVEIDTGQILLPQVFIEEYENSGLATPLSNKFYFREDELKLVKDSIFNHKITILRGAPGVGKSRLALAVFEEFAKSDIEEYTIYCLTNKYAPLHEDIRTFLQKDVNYLLLIDDANRQISHLKSILSILNEKRTGKIKIIITVRDYAYNEISNTCFDFIPNTITIGKFTDEQLTEILKSESLKVLHSAYVKRILEIADGNPRLAIMAAKAANKTKKLDSLSDASEIYDRYFKTLIDEIAILSNKKSIKVLGILSFFYSIDRSNKEFCSDLFRLFEINNYEFIELVETLQQSELVEISPDGTIVRISEQVLSTYFFYLAFFKLKVLDFSIILNNYFISHFSRVKDTIIPANNAFKYENVYKKITPYLDSYWKTIIYNEDHAFKFLEIFWFYKADNVFSFVYDKIESQEEIENPEFHYDEKKANQDYGIDSDRYIKLLSSFYHYTNNEFLPALKLGFEYVSKNPSYYWQLLKEISDNIVFSQDDYYYNFYRQHELWKLIIGNANINNVYIHAFYDLAPKFLKTEFHVYTSSRKKNTISWYFYSVPLNKPIMEIRESIWDFLNKDFSKNIPKGEDFIKEYLQRTPAKVKRIYTYDLDYLFKIFDTHFTTSSFTHCYLIQDAILWLRRVKISHPRFDYFKNHFINDIYSTYLILNYDRLREKYVHEFKDWEDYKRLKNKEIKSSFKFKNIDEFKLFYAKYIFIYQWKHNSNTILYQSLEVIAEASYIDNPNLGIEIIKEIARTGNETTFNPWKIINLINSSSDIEKINDFYDFINSVDFNLKAYWLLNFFISLPKQYISEKHTLKICELYESATENMGGEDFSFLNKYNLNSINVYREVLNSIVNHNDEKKIQIRLHYNFFSKNIGYYKDDLALLKKAYLQQDDLDNHFDYHCKELLTIIEYDDTFLIEYLEHISRDSGYLSSREYEGLSIIWKAPDPEKLIINVLDFFSKKKQYFSREDFTNSFFEKLEDPIKASAIDLLSSYLRKHDKDANRVNMVFDIIRHSFNYKLQEFISLFLSLNSSFEDFKKINWVDSYFFGSGDVNVSAMMAGKYQIIFDTLESNENRFKFSKHMVYLKDIITNYNREADRERKRKFMDDDW